MTLSEKLNKEPSVCAVAGEKHIKFAEHLVLRTHWRPVPLVTLCIQVRVTRNWSLFPTVKGPTLTHSLIMRFPQSNVTILRLWTPDQVEITLLLQLILQKIKKNPEYFNIKQLKNVSRE